MKTKMAINKQKNIMQMDYLKLNNHLTHLDDNKRKMEIP